MKTNSTITKTLPLLFLMIFLFACNSAKIDPDLVLDEVLIPEGFVQSDSQDLGIVTLLEEYKLENPGDHFYYLKPINGPADTMDEIIFPQKELLIEYVDQALDASQQSSQKYNGVIVKKIRGNWQDEEFKVFDTPAQPEGGMQGLYTALAESIVYPAAAKKAGIQGKVFVEFIVGKDGKLKDLEVKRGISAECDAEAIRALKESTSWQPAKVMDMPVEVKMILPINYKLG